MPVQLFRNLSSALAQTFRAPRTVSSILLLSVVSSRRRRCPDSGVDRTLDDRSGQWQASRGVPGRFHEGRHRTAHEVDRRRGRSWEWRQGGRPGWRRAGRRLSRSARRLLGQLSVVRQASHRGIRGHGRDTRREESSAIDRGQGHRRSTPPLSRRSCTSFASCPELIIE